MSPEARQKWRDAAPALARQGGTLGTLALLIVALWQTGVLEAVAGRMRSDSGDQSHALEDSKAYTDERTNAVSRDVAAIKEKIAALESTVKESLAEQKTTNRQVGELVGELRAIRRPP